MDQHGVKRCLAGVGQAGEDHAGNPEADDIITGHQRVGGVEVVVILGVLIRPAQGAERPQSRAEPGIQGIGVLGQVGGNPQELAEQILAFASGLSDGAGESCKSGA